MKDKLPNVNINGACQAILRYKKKSRRDFFGTFLLFVKSAWMRGLAGIRRRVGAALPFRRNGAKAEPRKDRPAAKRPGTPWIWLILCFKFYIQLAFYLRKLDAVFFCESWAAGIWTDAGHFVIEAENGTAAFFELKVVTLCPEFFFGKVWGIKADIFAGTGFWFGSAANYDELFELNEEVLKIYLNETKSRIKKSAKTKRWVAAVK